MNQNQNISLHQHNMNNQNSVVPQSNSVQTPNSQQNMSQFPSLQSAPVNSNASSNFPGQATDFNLDFLENMPSTDTSNFTDQELLSSLETEYGFNLQDIF